MPEVAMAEDRRDVVATPPAPPESGAPRGKDELDPELINLRRPAPRVGMITSAAIVLGCIVLMIRLRHDFAFARAAETPRAVAIADVVAGKIADESYVTFGAPLERAAAVRARVTEANAGTRVVPVAGSGDRLWIAVPGDAWTPYQHDEVVAGRLRAMSAVRFAEAIAGHVARDPSPRFVTGAELRRAQLAAGAGPEVEIVGGGRLAVRTTDEVEIVVPDPAASMVVATFSPRLPDVAAWTTALASAGVIAAGTAPTRTTEDTARWEVRRASTEVAQALETAALWGARAEPATARFRAPWDQLAVTDEGVRGPTGVIPWSLVDVAAIWAPRAVPADARVLLVDEKPGNYWYLPPVYVGLGLFAVLFTWALVLAIRRHFFDQPRVTPARA